MYTCLTFVTLRLRRVELSNPAMHRVLTPALHVQVKQLGAEVGVRFLTLGFEPSAASDKLLLIPDMRAPMMRAIPEWVADDAELAQDHVFSTACIQACLSDLAILILNPSDSTKLFGTFSGAHLSKLHAHCMLAGEPGLQHRGRHGRDDAAGRCVATGRGRPVCQLAVSARQAMRGLELAGTQLDAGQRPEVMPHHSCSYDLTIIVSGVM